LGATGDGGERGWIGAVDADGRQSLGDVRLGFASSDAGSSDARMALDGSAGFTGEVEVKQRWSRGAPLVVCEDGGARVAARPSFRRAEVALDGVQGLRQEWHRFRSAGERFSAVAEKADKGGACAQ
jgi:hypothetical protein